MGLRGNHFQKFLAAFAVTAALALPARADPPVSDLLAELREAGPEEARRLDREITSAWARSGSASMDLLLRRGRKALDDDDTDAAIEHLTALTDHAPDFAEGWHALARAYFEAELFGPALDALAHAITLEPAHYPAIFGLGIMFHQLDDEERAAQAFRQVLELHPHHESAQKALENLTDRGLGRSL